MDSSADKPVHADRIVPPEPRLDTIPTSIPRPYCCHCGAIRNAARTPRASWASRQKGTGLNSIKCLILYVIIMPAPLTKENRSAAPAAAGTKQFAHLAAAAAAMEMIEESMKSIDKGLLDLHSMYHKRGMGGSDAARELERAINLEVRTAASLIITYEKGMAQDGTAKYSVESLNKRIKNAAKTIYGENWSDNVYDHDISAIHKAKGHIRAAVEEHQPGDGAAVMLSRLEEKMSDQMQLLFNMMGLDPNKYSETLADLAELKHTLRSQSAEVSGSTEEYVGPSFVAQLGKSGNEWQPNIAEINERLKNFGKETQDTVQNPDQVSEK